VTDPRKMPSKKAIKEHWAQWLIDIDKFDSREEVFEDDYCFACGMQEKTERCHILARFRGGSDQVENLHLLCGDCHKASEFITGKKYFRWVKSRTVLARSFENAPGQEIINLIKKSEKK